MSIVARIWMHIAAFWNWLWNDVPRWSPGLAAAEAEEAARRLVAAPQDLQTIAKAKADHLRNQAIDLAKTLTPKIASTRPVTTLLVSVPRKTASKSQVEGNKITMVGAKKVAKKAKSAKKAAPKKATKKPRK